MMSPDAHWLTLHHALHLAMADAPRCLRASSLQHAGGFVGPRQETVMLMAWAASIGRTGAGRRAVFQGPARAPVARRSEKLLFYMTVHSTTRPRTWHIPNVTWHDPTGGRESVRAVSTRSTRARERQTQSISAWYMRALRFVCSSVVLCGARLASRSCSRGQTGHTPRRTVSNWGSS